MSNPMFPASKISRSLSTAPPRLAAVLVAGLLAVSANANIVQNGSFENTNVVTTSSFLGNVIDWTNSDIGEAIVFPSWYAPGIIFPPNVGVAGPLPQFSPDGGNFVFSDGNYRNSAIQQTLTGLTPGASYALSFYQALVQDVELFVTVPGPVTGFWQVSLGSSVLNSAFMNGDGSTLTISPWAQQTMVFTAQNATEVLSFLSVGTGDPPLVLLDGVDVRELPEPGTLGLLALGALAFGAAYRRTRWQRSG